MKQNVKLSTYSIIMSCICIILLGGIIINRINRGFPLITWLPIIALASLCILCLCYTPLSISVDDKSLKIHRSLKIKKIPLSEIQSVEKVSPTMSEKRICGSGGWFGYWGWMQEPTLGKYFAYYGKASDCFLVTLKDGCRYMLGCENPDSIVEYIKSRISNA